MKIAVYQTTDDVPDNLRFIAQLVNGSKFSFVSATGSSAEIAHGKMVTHYTEERSRLNPGCDPVAELGMEVEVPSVAPDTNLTDLLG